MSSRRKPSNAKRADSEEKTDTNGTADSDGELDYLPEGTVVVKPEPVGKRGTFSGPEFRSKKKEKKDPSTDFNSASANLGRVSCTACGEQVNTNKSGSVRKHPQLKVLVCKSCYKYHTSGPISRDEDGLDEQCRWCSEGGNLFGCDFCHNAFCKACIIRNLGRSEISNVTEGGKDWKCYVCDNTKLKPLLAECQKVLNYMEAEDKKAKEKMKQATTPKSNDAKKSSDSTKSNDAKKSSDSKKEATESKSENKASKSTDSKQLLKVLSTGNASNRSSSPSEFQKAILTKPHAGTTINTEKIVVDPMTGRSTKFEMVYPNANIVQTQYKSYARPVQPKPASLPTDGVSLPFTGLLPGNVHSVISNILSMTENLQQLLRNIQENVIEESNLDKLPFEISLRTLSQQQIEARLSAGTCVKKAVNLFLQEMAMKTSAAGVKAMTLSQKASQSSLAPALLAGSPLDRNGGAMNIDTPHKFDKPGGENSPLVTSTPKPKSSDDDSDVIVLSPSPKKTVNLTTDKSEACSSVQDDNDVTVVSENDKAAKELLKDAAEEIGDEDNDSDNDKDESSVKERGKDDKENESINSENDESSEKKGKKKAKSLVVKLGNLSKSKDKKDNSGQDKDEKEKVSSTTKDDEEEESSNSSRKTRSKKNDETDSEEKECKPVRKTRSRSQNSESDSNSSQSRGKTSPKKKESNDKSKTSEDKKNKKEDSSSKKTKSDKDKKSDSKVKSEDDDVDKEEKVKSMKDSDEEDSDSSDTEEESDSSEDEDFVTSKSRRSSRRLKKSAKKPDKKKKTEDDSSDFDSDLEKDIEKLSKNPTKSSKARTTKSSSKSEKSTKKAKESEKEKKTDKKKEKKKGAVSSSDDDDDKTEEDDDNTEIDEPEGEIDMDCSANAQAKEDLLKEMEEEEADEDNNQDSSDSEVIITPRKKRSVVKKAKYTIDSDSGTEEDMPKKKKKRDELLDAKLSSSDSDVVSKKKSKKRKAKSSSDDTTETDSEEEFIALGKKKKGKDVKKKAGTGKARKRRRIKAPSSSDDDEEAISEDEDEEGASKSEDEGDPNTPKRLKRKKIRKIKSEKKLTSETKSAAKAEEERRKRIAEKQKIFNGIVQEVDESSPTKCPITRQLVLDFEEETKKPLIEVDKGLVVKLKPHQVEAVQFVWDCTFESLKRSKTEEGSGCILAHCMGLGKTLSLITYIHTMLTNSKKTNVHTCVVVAPLNTVLNWQYEFEMWQEFTKKEVDVYEMSSVKVNADRAALLKNWHRDGGVLILGYDMLRNLSQGKHCRSKNMKKVFHDTLVDPGPDLVICDEGHILKNDQSAISIAMNQIKSRRRVVLTGTPLQNNLMEYHCMVDFVKPNLLGTSKEFRNRFVNPITNGQCADSTAHDVKIMKRRAHILHEKLNGCVQRKDYSSLTKYLPPKHEYVIAVRLSPVQIRLYEKYLELAGFGTDSAPKANRGARLFSDYQALMRIWTHPWVLKMDEIRQADRRLFDDESDFVDDSDGNDSDGSKSTDSTDSSTPSEVSLKSDISDGGRKTRSSKKKKKDSDSDDDSDSDAQKKGEVVKKWTTRRQRGDISDPEEDTGPQPVSNEWWAEYVNPEDEDKLELSGKLVLLFEILRMSEEIGDKVLVFSQSLLSLDLIEHFLEQVDQKTRDDGKPDKDNKDKDSKDKDSKDKDSKDKDNKGSDKKSEEDKKKENQNEDEAFGKHWTLGEDYFRMDGSHSAQARKNMAEKFNDPENYQCRLFLISTKAGGLGINLVAANRVIIFDASWNPSHDVQSIFRVYRFGQVKPVYVYRFLAQGTMEEKIYERQVTKQSLSQRVVDEHQIDRHFNANELAELYTFRPDRLDDPNRVEKTPMLPKDFMLAELMKSQKDWFVNYHEHDSLLENKIEEILDEDERKAAWEEYENERKGVIQMRQNFMANMPNIGFNNMLHQMQQQSQYGMTPMYNQGFNMQAFTQQNLLQLVQDMKQRYPHLPQEQLTQQVQTVIRQMVSRQIAAQQEVQKRQMEQKEMQHQRELQRIQDQIRQQQMQLMQATMAGARQGMGPGTSGPQAGTSTMQSLLSQPANANRLQQMREARK